MRTESRCPPSGAHVTVTLSRLGAPAQVFNFKPEADYLIGDQVVEEPHSFDMVIAADHKGETFRWGYSQVEARVEISDEVLKSIGVEIRTAGPLRSDPHSSCRVRSDSTNTLLYKSCPVCQAS